MFCCSRRYTVSTGPPDVFAMGSTTASIRPSNTWLHASANDHAATCSAFGKSALAAFSE